MPQIPPAVVNALNNDLPRFAVAASRPAPETPPSLVVRPSIARSGRTLSQSLQTSLAQGAATGAGAPVTVLGLDELAAGKPLRQVKPRLWAQILPAAEGGQQAMAEVDQGAGKVTSVVEGPQVRALTKRIAGLASPTARATSARQTLALIRVPALHLTAVWLQGAAGEADDVVIPNDGPIAPLVPGQRYSLAEFQGIVKAMATERLAKTGDAMGG
ncbi:MAG: hypothetical protein QM772_06545 [Ottowia sp.]|uniref:hypothetical protein n=1 Tax=Ottowia sp. TaxID=1898956 RepID=UPI0039E5466F